MAATRYIVRTTHSMTHSACSCCMHTVREQWLRAVWSSSYFSPSHILDSLSPLQQLP